MILDEDHIGPKEACRDKLLRNARTGRPCHLSQFYRYVTSGGRARSGERVLLEAIKCPGGFRTSRQAIRRFVERLSETGTSEASPARTSTQRTKASSRAARELELLGA